MSQSDPQLQAIASNLSGLSALIRKAASQRQHAHTDLTLIAVSKKQSTAAIEAAILAGQRVFGENYVQEGVAKILALKPQYPELSWHMIGPVQSNKTSLVAAHFDWVHTIDNIKTAQRLSAQRPAGLAPLQCLIQVNIDDEASKSGVLATGLPTLIADMANLPKVQLRGLMCIPSKDSNDAFTRMRQLLAEMNQGFMSPNARVLDCLSMGMSADFEAAIAQGATHIRLGTAIFGTRAG